MTWRHISMFRLKDECRNEETVNRIAQQLRDLPAQLTGVSSCEIGVKPFPMPTQSPDGNVQFYDLVQILTFDREEDCRAYPRMEGHRNFIAFSSCYMDKVVGLDYPLED